MWRSPAAAFNVSPIAVERAGKVLIRIELLDPDWRGTDPAATTVSSCRQTYCARSSVRSSLLRIVCLANYREGSNSQLPTSNGLPG